MTRAGAGRRLRNGFSLLELLVVIVLISILLSVAIERLLLMRARAESTAMEQVVGTLRSALQIRVAELLAKGRVAEVAALAGSNPMKRLAEVPANYLGEFFGLDPAALEPGNWYFDTRERTLVYLVDNADYFRSRLPPPPRARFVVEPVFEDVNRNGRYDAGIDTLHGLRLASTERYVWSLQIAWPEWPFQRPPQAESRGPG